MKLPFSTEQFLEVFEKYNMTIWPLQLLFYLLALMAILVSLNKLKRTDKVVTIILSFFWLWMGIVYHLVYFSAINKAAFGFGIAFILQAMLFLYFGLYQKRISFRFSNYRNGIMGSVFMVFALLMYPFLGYYEGHIFPASASFGLPCPTTIFTFGMLLWTDKKLPMLLLIVPLAWSLIGFSAAFSLGMREDAGLLVSGLVFGLLTVINNKKYGLVKHARVTHR